MALSSPTARYLVLQNAPHTAGGGVGCVLKPGIDLPPLPAEKYFIPVACFLMFNVSDWLGRSLTAFCLWVSLG